MALLTEAQRVFASYGIAPEELLWTGRPPAGIRLRRADIYLIPFSLMWAGLAILWECRSHRPRAVVFPAVGNPIRGRRALHIGRQVLLGFVSPRQDMVRFNSRFGADPDRRFAPIASAVISALRQLDRTRSQRERNRHDIVR